jgi:peroxiredoxin
VYRFKSEVDAAGTAPTLDRDGSSFVNAEPNGHDSAPKTDAGQVPLAVGSRAPDFTLHDAPHSTLSLSDLLGRASVLVFYVADWHPAASDQLAQLTAVHPEFERLGASVVGIAVDSPWSHAAFAAEKFITFPLLSDDAPTGEVARAFGVYSSASGRSVRALFVLNASGTVVWSGTFPDAVNPGVDAVLSALEAIPP